MVNGKPERPFPKVLFIIDMNYPVDDVAHHMARFYNNLGMRKTII